MEVQARLNLRELVRRHYAIAGVHHYLFVSHLDRLVLVRDAGASLVLDPASEPAWVDLIRPLMPRGPRPRWEVVPTVAFLPLSWSRGVLDPTSAPNGSQLRKHLEAQPIWGVLDPLPERVLPDNAVASDSELQRRLDAYRQQQRALEPDDWAGAIALLQCERLLCRQIDAASLQGAPRPEFDPQPWLEAFLASDSADDPDSCEGFSSQLMALLQLLPDEEQDAFGGALLAGVQQALAVAGAQLPASAALVSCLRLAEGLVGGINSRRQRLQEAERSCRLGAVGAALLLEDPGERGLALMRLLQRDLVAEHPNWLAALAACVDALVMRIGAAAGEQSKGEKRLTQQQLEQLIKAGASNLLLWRELVLQLDADTCYRLPTVQPPSACLVVLKGLLLVTSADLREASRARRMALVALFERLLPRLWWQVPLLVQLLRDLRRFPLELTWLERESSLLDPWLTFEARGVGPGGSILAPGGADAGGASPEPPLLQLQLLVLQRLLTQEEHRAGVAQRLASLAPSAIQRLLVGGSELPLLEAATAGLADRCVSLLRLQAEQWGVEELLPLLPAPLDVTAAFRHTLEHWRQHFGPTPAVAAAGEPLPISVVITTHAPDLERLRLALESLALQTRRPLEVLVVDDGTPEPLASELCQLLTLLRHALPLPIRLLRQEHNQGQYACRNIALAASRGEAIAIQDDDDLSHPMRLQCQWQAMKEGAVAVYARHLRLDQATASPQPDGDGLGFWGDGITTLLVRRQAAIQLGGFYPVRSRGDVEFRARLRRHYGEAALCHLEQPLYLMRAAGTTVSSDFEYGCSLRLRHWRRLVASELLV